MPMQIQALDPTVAAQIAAGPVIDRPAAVVKELIENALDAQATRIQIEVQGAGLRQLRITDNGIGIPADQLDLAFSRQATSKLRHTDDLWSLQSLGFRGEALASIASLAQVICSSRTAHASHGIELRVAGSQIQSCTPTSSNIGTSISVLNLFYNSPNHRAFLRSDSAEQQAITQVVTQYALAYPHVQFQLKHKHRSLIQTSGNGQLLDTITELYGPQISRAMLALQGSGPLQLSGYISAPGTTRSNRNALHVFVNGRAITSRGAIASIIDQAYHTLLASGQHPLGVLKLQLDPSQIDINIHPSKNQIRFRDPQQVYALLSRSIRDTLRQHASWASPPISLASSQPIQASPILIKAISTPNPIPTPPLPQLAIQISPHIPSKLPLLRVIGQLNQRYILAESADGLYLIDQQAALERVILQQLATNNGTQSTSYHLQLAPLSHDLSVAYQAQFQAWGFEFDAQPDQLHLTSIPHGLQQHYIGFLFQLLLDQLAHHPQHCQQDLSQLLSQPNLHLQASIPQTLSLPEMQQLIQQLEQCPQAHNCPHGHATIVHWGHQQISQQFQLATNKG